MAMNSMIRMRVGRDSSNSTEYQTYLRFGGKDTDIQGYDLDAKLNESKMR